MPFPVSFDQNEWCVLISFVINFVFVIILRKRFSLSVIILMFLFSAVIARLSDHLLAGPNSNFYSLMDTGTYDLFDLFTYFLYMPFAYLFVYFYDKWKVKGYYILLYVVGTAIGATAYEWLLSYFNVFNYHEWKIYYSLIVYLVVQPLTLLFFELLRKTYTKVKYNPLKF